MSPEPNTGRRRQLVVAATFVATMTLFGCAEGGGDDARLASSEPAFSAELRLLHATGEADVTFDAGEPITFELKVTNLTDGEQTVNLSDAQRFDLAVSDPSGTGVWQWSNGRVFAQVVTPLRFLPHETREFTAEWNQTDDAGKVVEPADYQASGVVFCGDPGCAAEAVPFGIR